MRQALEGELPQRQFGLAVRLEVASGCPPHLAAFLLQQFELQDADLYRIAAYTGLRLGELLTLRWEDVNSPLGDSLCTAPSAQVSKARLRAGKRDSSRSQTAPPTPSRDSTSEASS